ncbi:MAG: DMT family transporter [Candidatus Izemoplasmatales bacterium]
MMKRGKAMYLVLPIIAGVAIALQAVFSNKVSQTAGVMQAVFLVHAFGLLLALFILLIGKENFSFLKNFNIYAVLGGSLGVVIIFTIAKSITLNGVFSTVMVSVLIQMTVSKVIDHFGLFGVEKNPINLMHVIAILLMVSGVIIYQRSN